MIKVIASDLDGTLLNKQHVVSKRTLNAIKAAQKAGIRFVVITGRSFEQAMQALEDTNLVCDYIASSGAEVRNPQKEIVYREGIDLKDCKMVYDELQKYSVSHWFGGDDNIYCIGSSEQYEKYIFSRLSTSNQELTENEIREMKLFKSLVSKIKVVSCFEDFIKLSIGILKIFVVSNNLETLGKLRAELTKNPNLALASSFEYNLEITVVKAQKGPVLKKYIETLGYKQDEVMAFGDSLNDYSMLSMNFGATVAMENADEKVKKVAQYITKTNDEDGVAYAIEELLKRSVHF